ncbi:MAG TPA: hypothetical protein VMV18_06895, partial [bacterium]|nr:hypothetical protein [bacterium]
MRTRLGLGVAVLLLAVGAGCAAHHINKGDSAAATGDWKTAEMEYRTALAGKPNEPGLKEKHDQAATQAMAQSKAKAQACLQNRDFGCAVGEADYEVGLNPSDAEAQSLRTSARKAYALDDVEKAKAQVSGNPGYALDLLDHAKTMSNDAEVSQAIGATSSAAVNGLVTQANALQAQAGQAQGKAGLDLFDKSISLLDRAARADSRVGTNLQAARTAKETWSAGEYERIARLGDTAAAGRNWQGAIQQYQYAESFRPGGRARASMAYAQACA